MPVEEFARLVILRTVGFCASSMTAANSCEARNVKDLPSTLESPFPLVYGRTRDCTGSRLRTGAGVFFSQDVAEVRFDLARNLGGRSDFISDKERPNSRLNDPWAF